MTRIIWLFPKAYHMGGLARPPVYRAPVYEARGHVPFKKTTINFLDNTETTVDGRVISGH